MISILSQQNICLCLTYSNKIKDIISQTLKTQQTLRGTARLPFPVLLLVLGGRCPATFFLFDTSATLFSWDETNNLLFLTRFHVFMNACMQVSFANKSLQFFILTNPIVHLYAVHHYQF